MIRHFMVVIMMVVARKGAGISDVKDCDEREILAAYYKGRSVGRFCYMFLDGAGKILASPGSRVNVIAAHHLKYEQTLTTHWSQPPNLVQAIFV